MPPDSPQQPQVPRPPSHAIYRWMIVLLGSVLVLMALYRIMQMSPAPQSSPDDFYAQSHDHLAKYSVVPPFALTERSGKQITNRDLAGKIWVADFVYTTCPGPCPAVTAHMASLQKAVAADPHVQLVTFTVDPTVDTPDVLAKYAKQYGADPDRWWFLTGPEKPMYALIQGGFLQAAQDNRGQKLDPGQFTVTHSTEFALVDATGDVRGFYHSDGPTALTDLLNDIQKLEKEAGL